MLKAILIFILFLPVNVLAIEAKFKCQNKLTDKLFFKMSNQERKLCQKCTQRITRNNMKAGKCWLVRREGKYLPICRRLELKLRKKKICKLLKDAGLINWSHQQFIDIPRFNANSGIAYKYIIPCWEYGTNTPIFKHLT